MRIEFAKSLAGHDRNQIYLIVRSDERFLYLANGTTKTLEAPKKKNRSHLQLIKRLPSEVTDCLLHEITDTTIKRAIKLFYHAMQHKHEF